MYQKPLVGVSKESQNRIISESEIKDIFSNVDMMFQFNKKLIRDLERTKNKPDYSIGDVFLENVCLFSFILLYFLTFYY